MEEARAQRPQGLGLTQRVLVIRHASAGDSAAWVGDDRLRPLDARGSIQATRRVRDELAGERQQTDGARLVLARRGEDAAVGAHGGLSEAAFGQSQKKGEVLVIDGDGQVVERIAA